MNSRQRYYQKNKEEFQARARENSKQNYEANKEKIKTYNKQYREDHKEEKSQRMKLYREEQRHERLKEKEFEELAETNPLKYISSTSTTFTFKD